MKIPTNKPFNIQSGLIVLLLVLSGYMTVKQQQISLHLTEMEQTMYEKMQHRSKLDSVYWDHLSGCSFISKEDIKTDSRGYLYSIYHRNPTVITKP